GARAARPSPALAGAVHSALLLGAAWLAGAVAALAGVAAVLAGTAVALSGAPGRRLETAVGLAPVPPLAAFPVLAAASAAAFAGATGPASALDAAPWAAAAVLLPLALIGGVAVALRLASAPDPSGSDPVWQPVAVLVVSALVGLKGGTALGLGTSSLGAAGPVVRLGVAALVVGAIAAARAARDADRPVEASAAAAPPDGDAEAAPWVPRRGRLLAAATVLAAAAAAGIVAWLLAAGFGVGFEPT
ncbi:MAG: hypothetical protein ABR575_07750, partial [Actinomycetota bacterium]